MCQGINACAERKDYARFSSSSISTWRPRGERTSSSLRRGGSCTAGADATAGPGYVPIMRIPLGSRQVSARLTYPQVNEFFDSTVLYVLRTAFEIYKRDDLMSDLVNHFRGQAAAAPTATDAIYPRLRCRPSCGGLMNETRRSPS